MHDGNRQNISYKYNKWAIFFLKKLNMIEHFKKSLNFKPDFSGEINQEAIK